MVVTILAFGISKDIIGKQKFKATLEDQATVTSLKVFLLKKYPQLKSVSDFLLAINATYAKDTDILHPHDEIALIPPTNGG